MYDTSTLSCPPWARFPLTESHADVGDQLQHNNLDLNSTQHRPNFKKQPKRPLSCILWGSAYHSRAPDHPRPHFPLTPQRRDRAGKAQENPRLFVFWYTDTHTYMIIYVYIVVYTYTNTCTERERAASQSAQRDQSSAVAAAPELRASHSPSSLGGLGRDSGTVPPNHEWNSDI